MMCDHRQRAKFGRNLGSSRYKTECSERYQSCHVRQWHTCLLTDVIILSLTLNNQRHNKVINRFPPQLLYLLTYFKGLIIYQNYNTYIQEFLMTHRFKWFS